MIGWCAFRHLLKATSFGQIKIYLLNLGFKELFFTQLTKYSSFQTSNKAFWALMSGEKSFRPIEVVNEPFLMFIMHLRFHLTITFCIV